MEQRCFNQHGVGMYTVRRSLSKRELQTITFYRMAPKKEKGTYHRNEKCLDSSAHGKACLSIPEYSGINKGQRVPDRSKTTHKKPLVKCFQTFPNYMCFFLLAKNLCTQTMKGEKKHFY